MGMIIGELERRVREGEGKLTAEPQSTQRKRREKRRTGWQDRLSAAG